MWSRKPLPQHLRIGVLNAYSRPHPRPIIQNPEQHELGFCILTICMDRSSTSSRVSATRLIKFLGSTSSGSLRGFLQEAETFGWGHHCPEPWHDPGWVLGREKQYLCPEPMLPGACVCSLGSQHEGRRRDKGSGKEGTCKNRGREGKSDQRDKLETEAKETQTQTDRQQESRGR